MENRTRNIQKKMWFEKDELRAIALKMNEAKVDNFTEFMIGMALRGEILNFDFSELEKLRNEVRRIGVNINQIAKVVNETGGLEDNELDYLSSVVESLAGLIEEKIKLETSHVEKYLREKKRK